jgi:hypothetical protein
LSLAEHCLRRLAARVDALRPGARSRARRFLITRSVREAPRPYTPGWTRLAISDTERADGIESIAAADRAAPQMRPLTAGSRVKGETRREHGHALGEATRAMTVSSTRTARKAVSKETRKSSGRAEEQPLDWRQPKAADIDGQTSEGRLSQRGVSASRGVGPCSRAGWRVRVVASGGDARCRADRLASCRLKAFFRGFLGRERGQHRLLRPVDH